MSKINEYDLKHIMVGICQMQSLIHTLDEIQETPIYVKEIKMRTNSYLQFLEKRVNEITTKIDPSEAQYYVDLVAELDEVVKKVTLQIEV